ncbi:MAG: DUF2520 domain-containing protein [Caldisericaceae bacterium]|nr:DUF2520 domain-containing protein [Caldisericaceae bacterium]
MKVFIIGAGHVGTTLSIIFENAGFEVFIASRSMKSAKKAASISGAKACSVKECGGSDIVFLTVPDSEITNAAKNIEQFVTEKQVIVHTSGALSSEILNFLPSHVASLHPLKSFADPVIAASSIKETLFTFEGDKTAETVLEEIVKKIKGKFVKIKPQNKILYHLAAVLAANYTVSLADISVNILKEIGFRENDAKSAIVNLLKGVLENMENKGTVSALTGPIERGDADTVKKHLTAIKDPILKNIYIFLGFATLSIAEQKGLNKRKIDDIRKVLNEQNNCSEG